MKTEAQKKLAREAMQRCRARRRGENVPYLKLGRSFYTRMCEPKHGTPDEYYSFGCRCDACRDAASLDRLNYNKLNPTPSRNASRRHKIASLELIRELKNVQCTDCGIKYPYYVMQFDHLRDKKVSLGGSRASSLSKSTIIEEAKKCEVVCANCHFIRTQNRLKPGNFFAVTRENYDLQFGKVAA